MYETFVLDMEPLRQGMEAVRDRPYVHVRIQRDQLKIGGVQTTYDVTCDRCPNWEFSGRLHYGAMQIGKAHHHFHENGAI